MSINSKNMKKIMIVGAGFLQSFLIKKANSLGYYTIAIDKDENAEGFKYSDKSYVVDIVDLNEALKVAQQEKIDAVITGATDYGVLTTSYIANKMNLIGLDYDVVNVIKDKYQVRRRLTDRLNNNIQYYEFNKGDDLEALSDMIQYPVIVKPSDGSGSKGTNKVKNSFEFKKAVPLALNASIKQKAIIETFIEGVEYGVESFVTNGQVEVMSIMEKEMATPPVYAELGHTTTIDSNLNKKISPVIKEAIECLGIDYGAVNMDVLLSDKGVYIIDIGARMGGNLIASHLVPLSTGVDYLSLIIESALDENIKVESYSSEIETNNFVATKILAFKEASISILPDMNAIEKEYDVQIYHSLEIGKKIKDYKNNLDGEGYIISVSKNKVKAQENARAALEKIKSIILQ